MINSMFKAAREAETIGYISSNLTSYSYNEEAGPSDSFKVILVLKNKLTRMIHNKDIKGINPTESEITKFSDEIAECRKDIPVSSGDGWGSPIKMKDERLLHKQLDDVENKFKEKIKGE